MRVLWLSCVIVTCALLSLTGCGRRRAAESSTAESSTTASSDGSGSEAQPETLGPEQLDERYRETARHLVRGPVWDSPLRSLSAEGLAALRQYSASQGNPETYETLEVTSPDWSVMRHDVSGAVVGRSVGAVTIARFPDGRCLLYGTSLRQEYVGGDFSPTLTSSGTGGGASVPCETIDAISAARPDVAR